MSLDNQRNLKLAIHRDPVFLKVAEQVAGRNEQVGARLFRPPDDRRLEKAARLHDEDLSPAGAAPRRPARAHMPTAPAFPRPSSMRRSTSSTTTDGCAMPAPRWCCTCRRSRPPKKPRCGTTSSRRLEQHLGLPDGAIKVYVLVEQVEACFQLMEIRAALGKHFVGFNTGRWDYINSVSDAMAWDREFVNPNIDAITMTYGYMRIYEDRVRRAVQHARQAGPVCPLAGWHGAEHPGRLRGRRRQRHEAGGRRGRARTTRGRQRQVGRPLEDGSHRPAGLGKGRTGQPARDGHFPRSRTRRPTRTVSSCSNRRREPFAAPAIC